MSGRGTVELDSSSGFYLYAKCLPLVSLLFRSKQIEASFYLPKDTNGNQSSGLDDSNLLPFRPILSAKILICKCFAFHSIHSINSIPKTTLKEGLQKYENASSSLLDNIRPFTSLIKHNEAVLIVLEPPMPAIPI
ncbi:hypothetical protein AVEN_113023-1 [Araneus ventricosus]|uniref:Uncharacterized protein n=1 Tax=Araneus ventricosus TaxID=182803 RepID=A0A4Y2RPD7_ARAVE|nr:hypothetical protein AVEN_113023-1 [Araneus ventricosus]